MMRRHRILSAALLCMAAAATFGLKYSTAASEQNGSAASTEAEAPNPSPQVSLTTSVGKIVLELDRRMAPESVENFLEYVESDFYNGTIFHRVIDGFMIQGGGFSADYKRKDTRAPIRNEANNGLKNRRYTIAMARTNAPHSATSQFFINTQDNDPLDHTGATARGWGYAVFGRVIEGTEVVDKISGSLTGPGGPFSRDAPQTLIIIDDASLVGGDEDLGSEKDQKPAASETPKPTTDTKKE